MAFGSVWKSHLCALNLGAGAGGGRSLRRLSITIVAVLKGAKR